MYAYAAQSYFVASVAVYEQVSTSDNRDFIPTSGSQQGEL